MSDMTPIEDLNCNIMLTDVLHGVMEIGYLSRTCYMMFEFLNFNYTKHLSYINKVPEYLSSSCLLREPAKKFNLLITHDSFKLPPLCTGNEWSQHENE